MTSPSAPDRPSRDANSLSLAVRMPDMPSEALSLAKASERLIQRFGGIRPMANKLEVPVTTVQGWKKRGAIPATRLADLRLAAQRHGIPLEEAELDAVGRSDERHGEVRPAPVEAEPSAAADTPVDAALAAPVLPAVAPPPPPRPADPASLFRGPASTPSGGSAAAASVPPATMAAAATRLGSIPLPPPAPGRAGAFGPTRLSFAAALVALLAAAVAVWSPSGSSTPGVGPDERRLGDLEGKISRVALDQGTQAAVVDKRLGALDLRLGQMAGQQAVADLAQRIATLEKELPVLQQRIAAQGIGSPALAVLLAATQLRNGLNTSNPFVNELAAFRLTGAADAPLKETLERIASRAATGIASESWLIGRFSAVQGTILRAASVGNPLARMGDVLLDALSDVAPPLYRLTGVSDGATPRALADHAQALMAAGDFARAVEQVGGLSGLPAEVAAPWLAEARARVAADQARIQLAKLMLSIAPPGR